MLNKENEKIFRDKFSAMVDDHFDNLPFFADMEINDELFLLKVREEQKRERQYKTVERKKKYRRIVQFAAIFCGVLICSSAIGITISSGGVEAGKDKIWDIINGVTGNDHLITDQPYSLEITTTDDEKNINKAKELIPNLIIHPSIMGDYVFDSMAIEKFDKNNILVSSTYFKDDSATTLSQSLLDDNHSNIEIDNPLIEKELNGGTLFIYENIEGTNEQNSINSAIFIKDNQKLELMSSANIKIIQDFMEKEIKEFYK